MKEELTAKDLARLAYDEMQSTCKLETRVGILASVIAAAEERGRRRGVEERDAVLKELYDYCLHMFPQSWLVDSRNRSIFAAHVFSIVDAALAPRDSAPLPTPKMQPMSPEQRAAELRRASPRARVDEPEAPRDSGKE